MSMQSNLVTNITGDGVTAIIVGHFLEGSRRRNQIRSGACHDEGHTRPCLDRI